MKKFTVVITEVIVTEYLIEAADASAAEEIAIEENVEGVTRNLTGGHTAEREADALEVGE